MPLPLYPLLFRPVYKDYLWGGDRILRHYHREAPPGIYAESWEVSDRPEGMSVVANGPLAGTSLADLVRERSQDLLGRTNGARFPLLLKIIDARETLSVQVHPDDEAAAQFGGEAKSEMWYVLAAAPDAAVYCGLFPDANEGMLRAAIAEGTADQLMRRIRVRAGDAVFVPGGRVHAIGSGCLLFECQQNSNTTYRLYDWGRVGGDGRPRALHVEEGLRVIRWDDFRGGLLIPAMARSEGACRITELLSAMHFTMSRLELSGNWRLPGTGGFSALFVAEGSVVVRGGGAAIALTAGTTTLIPAALESVNIQSAGPATLLRITT